MSGSDGFETSAGKQVQWADHGEAGKERKEINDHGFRTASRGISTANSSGTAKSRADTAIETLFAVDLESQRTSVRRPKSTAVDERTVLFCGLKLSLEDYMRAQDAKMGHLAGYVMSGEHANDSQLDVSKDTDCESPVLFSPVMTSPLSQRRGARLQRRTSRAQGVVIDKGSSSEEEIDYDTIEFGILQGDAAEAEVDESKTVKEEVVFSRVSSTASVKELKKRHRKKVGHRAGSKTCEFDRAPSADPNSIERAPSSGSQTLESRETGPSSQRRVNGTVETAPRYETGNMKIAALEKAMVVEKVEAFDSSLVVDYDAEEFQKIFELDLEGADEGVVKKIR